MKVWGRKYLFIYLTSCLLTFCLASLRLARNDDDEEEAARERRRRARQERLMSRESEEPSSQTDSLVTTNSHRWHIYLSISA